MKYWILGIFFLAGCVPLFAVQAPPGWQVAQYDFYYYEGEDRSLVQVPDYKLGDQKVHASDLDYTCDVEGTSLSIPDNPGKSCYSAFLASDAFTDKPKLLSGDTQTINSFLRIVPTYSGSWNTERPAKRQWKETWTLQFSPDAIKLFPVSQEFNWVLGTGKILVDIQNDLPANMEGGINIIITDTKLFKQEDKNYPLTLTKGRNRYELPIKLDTLGTVKIDLQAYIKVYDTSSLTSEDTGICFTPTRHGSKQCYQKKTIAFDHHLLYKYGVFPTGTDLTKDVTTDCKTTSECPTTFSCKSNICTRTKGQTQENILQEAFIKQPRSDLLPVLYAIALIMIVVLVTVKARGK